MKAKEIKEEIYIKLVSLEYSRKENYISEVNSIGYSLLDNEVRDVIDSFPIRVIDSDVDLMSIEDLDGEQQFYVFHTENQVYLVDTQGYTYPRYIIKLGGLEAFEDSEDGYIVELEGFNDEDDTFGRMDGLIRVADEHIFNSVVKNLVYDLHEEGFEQDDIEPFLQVLLLRAIQNTK
jgi:hypothetical protein